MATECSLCHGTGEIHAREPGGRYDDRWGNYYPVEHTHECPRCMGWGHTDEENE